MKETLNLLPAEAKAGSPKKRGKFYYLFLMFAAYCLVMTTLWLFIITETKQLDAELNRLNKQKIELQKKIVLPQVSVSPSVDSEILNAMEKTPKWSLTLRNLSVVVPENIWLSSIESKEDKGVKHMNIKGFSTNQIGVANLISALEASNHFYDIEIVFAQKGDKDVSFELKAKLKWT